MSKIGERVKNMVRNWLSIQPAIESGIHIAEPLSFETSVIKNQIWYRGDACELDQLFKQLANDNVAQARFWAAASSNEKIRKIHSGLPALIADTLTYIVKSDMSEVEFIDKAHTEKWKTLTDNEGIAFLQLVGDGINDALVSGDGAFKISIDTDISPYPIVEFFSADRVDYISNRGRVTGINFYTTHKQFSKAYRLQETYEVGKISYKLYDGLNEVALSTIKDLQGLKPVTFGGNYIMAVPLMFYKNPKFCGRGKSIFETKTDDFDAHDEVISQWIDALRAGRVQKYIPESMIPRSEETGELLPVNSFGTNFIQIQGTIGEDETSKIEVVQPEIRYDAFLSTYAATLDMCLQGTISPATLGIDLGKMSSADAQREKKDITGHTRNTITAVLEKTLPRLISAIMMTYDNLQNVAVGTYEPSISFGEYGAPDFDTRVETVSKASTMAIMSVETQIDELWGSSKDEKWKEAEVIRIKQLKGIETLPEPFVGADAL